MKNYILLITCIGFLFACSEKKQNSKLQESEESLATFKPSIYTTAGDTVSTLIFDKYEWTAENINIPLKESWCYENKTASCNDAGRLYRWENALEACKSLGDAWRLPADQDWQKLVELAGGYFDYTSEKMTGDAKKSNHWLGDEGNSGFNAKLNGWRGSNGGYSDKNIVGFYWTATELDDVEAFFYIFYPKGGKLTRRAIKKRMGMSCRCVRDLL